jgi:predicted O-methyltransferase YrrM
MARLPVLRAIAYVAEALRFRILHDEISVGRLVADYSAWRQSLKRPRETVLVPRPWITFGAIHFVESRLDPRARIFEFGAGGSTLFWASRAREVYSVEHDPDWSRQVAHATSALGLRNVTILLVEPSVSSHAKHDDPADPDAYRSSDPQFADRTFRDYAAAIDRYPDGWFKVVLHDGRARPPCFKHAVRKLAPGGLLILDNAERLHYGSIERTLDDLGWRRRDFSGPAPHNQHFWKTTTWDRRE